MKWERVKKEVATNLCTKIQRLNSRDANAMACMDAISKRQSHRLSIVEFSDACYEIIMEWDIRMAGRLREMFPDHFPRSLTKGSLIGEIDEKGNWQLFKQIGVE